MPYKLQSLYTRQNYIQPSHHAPLVCHTDSTGHCIVYGMVSHDTPRESVAQLVYSQCHRKYSQSEHRKKDAITPNLPVMRCIDCFTSVVSIGKILPTYA